MKELSIEQKAKAYDEALEKGKQIQNTPYTAHWDIMKEVAEHLLPELKESEDERIRKELIDFVKSRLTGFPQCEKYIAWLEKQGQTFTKKDVDNAYLKGVCDAKQEFEKQDDKIEPIEGFNTEFERQISQLIASIINEEHEYTEAFVKWVSNVLLNYAKHEIDKQGEQKPILNFNANDWYVSKTDSKIHNMHHLVDKVEPKFKKD